MREKYIARVARSMGLDPAAVLAIASHEGLSGGVGDGGHAFGPFQLNNAGGVLSNQPASHQNNQWAWSNAGIKWALQHMVADTGTGLTGANAVRAIATKFERPADPASEIRDALSKLGQYGGTVTNAGGRIQGGGVGTQVVNGGGTHSTTFDSHQYQVQSGVAMMTAATAAARGDLSQMTALPSTLAAARKAATMKVNSTTGQPVVGQGTGPANQAAKIAERQLGTPYVWGGSSKAGFDCSGLISFAYAKLGINLPRTSGGQATAGRAVSYNHLKPGDILANNDHVVMYVGNGKVIQAPHSGTSVSYAPLSWFPPDQYSARRITG